MFDEWVVTYSIHDTPISQRMVLHKDNVNQALADADHILSFTHPDNYTITRIERVPA
jgi:hypothetical protein